MIPAAGGAVRFEAARDTRQRNVMYGTMTAMAKQISERAALRSRIAMTRERLRRAISGELDPREDLTPEERAEYRAVREEIQADTDMDMDPDYAPLLEALKERLGARRVYELVFHPEKVLADEVTYPLRNDEAAVLLAELLKGIKENGREVAPPAAWTLERMVEERLLPTTPQIGGGSLPRNAYFARHIVAAAYRSLFVPERPEVLKAEVAIAQHKLAPTTAAYMKVLPDTDPVLISSAVEEPI